MSENKPKELEKRTIQLIGFGFAIALTVFKLAIAPEADVPWWVVFGFFGFGASANFDILDRFGKK